MNGHQTQMYQEIMEIPCVVERLLIEGAEDIRATAKSLRELDPAFIISIARGSSDHVATYFKYASELLLGIPVASIGPSIASIYKCEMALKGAACISISQSGKSPDILEMTRMATSMGAVSVAITNETTSPLANQSSHVLSLHAGTELSIAATKTFVTSAVSAIWLLAEWADDATLRRAIFDLPRTLEKALNMDWSSVKNAINKDNSLFCLGRGPSLAIAHEAALKFKETCQIHAESYSSAEVLHGPVSIVGNGFSVIAFAADDAAGNAIVEVADNLSKKEADVFITSEKLTRAHTLPVARTGHPLTDPIALITSFYVLVEQIASGMGKNPDAPRHLNKVTETV